MRRSPRLRVASNLNGGYEKRVCRPERATVRREISDESHTEVSGTEREESAPPDEKCRLYWETGRDAFVGKTARGCWSY